MNIGGYLDPRAVSLQLSSNTKDDVLRELDELNSRIERAIISGQMNVCGEKQSNRPPRQPLVISSAIIHAGLSVPTC